MPSLVLLALILLVALVYASVGHGGASGYLAVMALVGGYSSAVMGTSALLLNLLVAGTAWFMFWRAGHGSWSLLWPFAVCSIPAALFGGWLSIPAHVYRWLLAGCLLVAAIRLCLPAAAQDDHTTAPPLAVAMPVGAAIGLVSGVVGVGGGIFLSPLMVLWRWATVKRTAAISAAFIVVNSLAGLAGRLAAGRLVIGSMMPLVVAAFVGGLIGARLGAHHFSGLWLRRMLAAVLVVASIKLLVAHA